jgi:pimeloyl-ACP methyl ester carboxylesterase
LDQLSDGDSVAVRLLPADPEGACAGFMAGFDLVAALESPTALYEAFEPFLSDWDRRVWSAHSEHLLVDMREAMCQGVTGCGWDNVAWIGDWDVDPSGVACPVLLWYGAEDRMATPTHGYWFEQNLPNARLTMRAGEGHLQAFAHLQEMLGELTTAGAERGG